MKPDVEKIPRHGHIFAYFRTGILFAEYVVKDSVLYFAGDGEVDWDDILGCHCFNEKFEYRMLISQRNGKLTEMIISEEQEKQMPAELLKEEVVLIKSRYWKNPDVSSRLRIVNHYRYDKNDVLYVYNYRLAGVV